MQIRRETLRVALFALLPLAFFGFLMLLFGSTTAKTDSQVSPAEALMAETSFTESASAAEPPSAQIAEEQADQREERVEACREDVEDISEAVEEANEEGKPAGSVTQLEQEGFLDETPELAPVLIYTLEVSQGRPTGLVLVNGLPAPMACETG